MGPMKNQVLIDKTYLVLRVYNKTIQPPEVIFRLGAYFVGAELVVLLFRD